MLSPNEITVRVKGETFTIRFDADPASLEAAHEKCRELAGSQDPVEGQAGIELFALLTTPPAGIYPYPH
jgi:hypothetical protein